MNTCKKCHGNLISIHRNPKKQVKASQLFYYSYHYVCEDCATQYMPNESKVYIDREKIIKRAEIQAEQLLKTIKQLKE